MKFVDVCNPQVRIFNSGEEVVPGVLPTTDIQILPYGDQVIVATPAAMELAHQLAADQPHIPGIAYDETVLLAEKLLDVFAMDWHPPTEIT